MKSSKSRRFRILDHPADIGIEAWGEGMAEAFENAAVGLISVIINPDSVAGRNKRPVHLMATDPEQLLVKWLEEILYLYDGEGFAVSEIHLEMDGATGLKGTLTGEAFSPEKHEPRLDVKAVTYHQLSISREEELWTVRVFIDI